MDDLAEHIVLLERDDWAKKALDDIGCKEPMRKGFVSKASSIDKENRTFDITISSESEDRDRDIIFMSGWDLKDYRKNPVVQWAHDHKIPAIAASKKTAKDGDFLVGTPKFPEAGIHPFADMIFDLYANDILRAASVGMLPMKYEYNEERRGYDFLKHILLEYSLCNVPSNPEALRRAKSFGISLAPMKEWAIQVLDEDTPGLWIPMSKIQHALKISEGDKVSVTVKEDVCPECERREEEDNIKIEEENALLKSISGLLDASGNPITVSVTDKGGLFIELMDKEEEEEEDIEEKGEETAVEEKEEVEEKKETKKEGKLAETSGTDLLLSLSKSPKASILDEITGDLRGQVREAVASGMTAFTGKLD